MFVFPRSPPFGCSDRLWVLFAAAPCVGLWGFGFLFVLLLTSLLLEDLDVWLAFVLAVVLPLWVCRFATFAPSVVLRGMWSQAVRGPLWCPATPRDGLIPRRRANGR